MSLNSGSRGAAAPLDHHIANSVARALHQTTQPLTVLQGTLEIALLKTRTVAEYQHAIRRSLEELRRITESFEHLRTLIRQPASVVAGEQAC
jgi:hypothetical protein